MSGASIPIDAIAHSATIVFRNISISLLERSPTLPLEDYSLELIAFHHLVAVATKSQCARLTSARLASRAMRYHALMHKEGAAEERR